MLITAIRNKSNEKLTAQQLERVADALLNATESAGYKTGSEVKNTTSIKVGLHMSSFRVMTEVHGHNARVCRFVKSPKGYKRTDVPTWNQRVEFNDIINDVLDRFGIVANIKSGCFTVRTKNGGRANENQWAAQVPTWLGHYSGAPEILPEDEARDALDSDALELKHKLETRPARLAQARESRMKRKQFEACTHVIVSGLSSWPKPHKLSGKRITKDAFYKLISKLSSWESKRVKKATVDATLKVHAPKLELVHSA